MEEIIETTIKSTMSEMIKYSNLICYDRVSIIISISAIIVSILVAIWTVRKDNNRNYNILLYEDLLKEALNIKIPSMINKTIDVNSKTISDVEFNKLIKYLEDLRKVILVFKYTIPNFYNELDRIIVKLDEELVIITSREENFEEKYNNILKELKKLYDCVKKYLFK